MPPNLCARCVLLSKVRHQYIPQRFRNETTLQEGRKGLLCLIILLSCIDPTWAVANRLPTLEDAYAVKSTGRISVNPRADIMAFEAGGGIIILSTSPRAREVRRLDGSAPAWSPDGRRLAFYAKVNGQPQLHVWQRDTDFIEQITRFREGISPNPFYYQGDSRRIAWSPDSRRIAFSSRVMSGYESLGQPESPSVRVLTRQSTYVQLIEGLYSTASFWDVYAPGSVDFDPVRMRAIGKRPRLGLNKLFTTDVRTKEVKQLTKDGQHFFPAWSPDGRWIAAIADVSPDVTENVEGFGINIHTALAIFDVATGQERRIAAPPPITLLGTPHWSADSSRLVLTGNRLRLGFTSVHLYSVVQDRWSLVPTPKGMSAQQTRWSGDGRCLWVLAADRFHDSLWIIDPATGDALAMDTGNLDLGEFQQTARGELFFSASAREFAGRIYKGSREVSKAPQVIYDPNPQLENLLLGEQQRITWHNGAGEEVDGILILPPNYRPGRRYPVIVDLYPKPARDGFKLRPSAQQMGQLQAARGYVVFELPPRAPHAAYSFTQDQRYTEKARGAAGISIMLDDITSGIEHVVRLGITDPERVCVFGHSNGGYIVNLLIVESAIAKCAVVSSGLSNWTLHPVGTWAGDKDNVVESTLYDNREEFIRLTPLFRMNQVATPLLMLIGDQDYFWLHQMITQFEALRYLGKDVTLLRYAREEHVISRPEDVKDALSRIHAFYDQHIGSQIHSQL